MSKILITDDDRAIRNLLAYSLAAHLPGLEFETCQNGSQAVDRMLAGGDIDLLLLDIRMPRLDGIEALRRIRQFSQVPAIVLSAYGDEATRQAANAAGADLFVAKPADYQWLAVQIHKYINRYRATYPKTAQLQQLHHNLNYLEQQAAEYGAGQVPLALHNQIEATRAEIEAAENE